VWGDVVDDRGRGELPFSQAQHAHLVRRKVRGARLAPSCIVAS
jgi:hypothetical protein